MSRTQFKSDIGLEQCQQAVEPASSALHYVDVNTAEDRPDQTVYGRSLHQPCILSI